MVIKTTKKIFKDDILNQRLSNCINSINRNPSIENLKFSIVCLYPKENKIQCSIYYYYINNLKSGTVKDFLNEINSFINSYKQNNCKMVFIDHMLNQIKEL